MHGDHTILVNDGTSRLFSKGIIVAERFAKGGRDAAGVSAGEPEPVREHRLERLEPRALHELAGGLLGPEDRPAVPERGRAAV